MSSGQTPEARSRKFSYHQERSISRSSSQKRGDSRTPRDVLTRVHRCRSLARPATPSGPMPSAPRAQRSHSSPPKPTPGKAVKFADGTKGGPTRGRSQRRTGAVPDPASPATDAIATTPEPGSRRHARTQALTSPPDIKPLRSLSISPRKTQRRQLQGQLEAAEARIATLEGINERLMKRLKEQEAHIEFLDEKNTQLFEQNVRLTEEIYALSLEKTLLQEGQQ